jgi:hypothetical protein
MPFGCRMRICAGDRGKTPCKTSLRPATTPARRSANRTLETRGSSALPNAITKTCARHRTCRVPDQGAPPPRSHETEDTVDARKISVKIERSIIRSTATMRVASGHCSPARKSGRLCRVDRSALQGSPAIFPRESPVVRIIARPAGDPVRDRRSAATCPCGATEPDRGRGLNSWSQSSRPARTRRAGGDRPPSPASPSHRAARGAFRDSARRRADGQAFPDPARPRSSGSIGRIGKKYNHDGKSSVIWSMRGRGRDRYVVDMLPKLRGLNRRIRRGIASNGVPSC